MLLVVGDVAGHGIDAVTGMVAARNSLRGLAITGAGPAELLGMLNGVMCHLTSGVVGTVVCGLYNPETRVLRWARAGHLPPVLVRGGTAAASSRCPAESCSAWTRTPATRKPCSRWNPATPCCCSPTG